jgi:nitrogen regulatory protein P-II 1
MYLLLLVLNDPSKLDDLLTAWENAGASGITVIPSTGIGRLKQHGTLQEDFPLMPSIDDVLSAEQKTNRTIFTIVKGESLAEKLIKAAEEVIGDLNEPGTGILAMLPLSKVLGLNKNHHM